MVMHVDSSQGTEGTDASNYCCPKLTGLQKIPLARIESYWWTSSKCAIKAVVFYTVAGKRFCVDPSWDWVKSHMKTLPEKKPSTTSKP
ncbi:hypothetical protein AOLI_G00056130 [Acnodon oligacanthus]